MPDFPLPPTPWTVDPDEREGMDHNNHVFSSDRDRICFMAMPFGDPQPLQNAATLIAAAPDLLEALEECLAELWPGRDFGPVLPCIEKARAAIAKAKGEGT